MTSLELDHVFCFCAPELPEATQAESVGLRVNEGRRHENQGTANRSILFEKNYLELIYLASKEEAEGNPLQLHCRANWKATGASPFGVALRGTLAKHEKLNFWEYRPSYLPSGAILIHKEDGGKGPLIFLMPPRGESNAALYPAQWPNIDLSLMRHPMGAKTIVSVKLNGPDYEWPLLSPVPCVAFAHANEPHMEIVIDGNLKSRVFFNDLLSIAGLENS